MENHENLRISYENQENNENPKIANENNENHESSRISLEITKKMKIVEFHL